MEFTKLVNICKPKQWKTIATSDLQASGYPVYGANGVIGYYSCYNHEKPTILITCRGATCGEINVSEPFSYINGNAMCLDDLSSEYNIDFIAYYLKYYDFSKVISGSAQPQITRDNLKGVIVPLIPVAEQKQIVLILNKVTSLIALRKKQLEKLDELVKSRFIEMFGNFDSPHYSLIDLIIDGVGLSYGIVQPGDDGTGDMGVLRPVDLVDGKISNDSIKYIDRSLGDGFKKTELNGDELLITVRGTTGITALTDARHKGMNVTRGIAVIRYDRNKINPTYLNAFLNTDESQRYIQDHTRGATLKQINLSDLRVQQILVPPKEKQNQFADFVMRTDKSKLAVQKSLEQLETLKKSLMQKYFG